MNKHTIESKLRQLLEQHGLWPQEVDAVIAAMKSDEITKSMAQRWNDDADGYPPQMMAVLWTSAKRQAREWIDANKPKHFARAMFE